MTNKLSKTALVNEVYKLNLMPGKSRGAIAVYTKAYLLNLLYGNTKK